MFVKVEVYTMNKDMIEIYDITRLLGDLIELDASKLTIRRGGIK